MFFSAQGKAIPQIEYGAISNIGFAKQHTDMMIVSVINLDILTEESLKEHIVTNTL